MAIPVLALLAVGAVAILAMSGKKKTANGEKTGNGKKDDTGPIPEPGPGPIPPPANEQQGIDEAAYVHVAVDALPQGNWAPVYHLGQDGIDQGVLGIDEDGFVRAASGDWMSDWLTRVAYWGAYQMQGWPLELPIQCFLEVTCPEDMMPVRNALLRINALVKAKMAEYGLQDSRLP